MQILEFLSLNASIINLFEDPIIKVSTLPATETNLVVMPPTSTGALGEWIITHNSNLQHHFAYPVFNFTKLTLFTGATLDFRDYGADDTIYILAVSDIGIDGTILTDSASLVISTPRTLTINGELPGTKLILLAGTIRIGDSACFGGYQTSNSVTLTPDNLRERIINNQTLSKSDGIFC